MKVKSKKKKRKSPTRKKAKKKVKRKVKKKSKRSNPKSNPKKRKPKMATKKKRKGKKRRKNPSKKRVSRKRSTYKRKRTRRNPNGAMTRLTNLVIDGTIGAAGTLGIGLATGNLIRNRWAAIGTNFGLALALLMFARGQFRRPAQLTAFGLSILGGRDLITTIFPQVDPSLAGYGHDYLTSNEKNTLSNYNKSMLGYEVDEPYVDPYAAADTGILPGEQLSGVEIEDHVPQF